MAGRFSDRIIYTLLHQCTKVCLHQVKPGSQRSSKKQLGWRARCRCVGCNSVAHQYFCELLLQALLLTLHSPEGVLQGLYKAFRQTVCRRKVGRTCLVPDAVSLHELRQFFTRKLWTVVRYECDRQPIPNKDAA